MLDEQTPAEPGNAPTTSTPESTPESTLESTADAAPAAADTPGTTSPTGETPAPRKRAPRKTAAKKTAAADSAPAAPASEDTGGAESPDAPAPARRTRKTAKKAAPPAESVGQAAEQPSDQPADLPAAQSGDEPAGEQPPAKKTAAKRTAKKTTAKRASAAKTPADAPAADAPPAGALAASGSEPTTAEVAGDTGQAVPATAPLFQPPDPAAAKPVKKTTRKRTPAKARADQPDGADQSADEVQPAVADLVGDSRASETAAATAADLAEADADADDETSENGDAEGAEESEGGARRRRRRGGRRRRKGPGEGSDAGDGGQSDGRQANGDQTNGDQTNGDQGNGRTETPAAKLDNKLDDKQDGGQGPGEKGQSDSDGEGGTSTRRRRRRRRAGEGDDEGSDDDTTVTRVRKPRTAEDEITSFSGSTRLEAKKQRRREGREAGRRRAPIISEAEFLARRESVDRKMVIRQRDDLTQIAVLEDKVLVEHYVARESQTSLIGNVYLGRVQNVLPSMEAAFIDIGKGRNAVLYAGEVNWDSLGAKDGNQRKIEQVLKPGQPVLVQVSKDPIGHKGARLTSQISLPGRFLVYVPDGNTSGISRKLPENERNRLKTLLKEIVPDSAGVIVRTAAEGASEDELTRDVERLKALWEDISAKVEGGNAPQLLYGEPDLTLKVVRDLFTEDIAKLVVSGAEAWEMVENYVGHVAPDLADRLEKHDDSERDAFAEYRIDEQINKALDRKVWLPSGGSLVIDRTEAMTVVDVNTGKFTGSGGNLEETVTKNNLEAAEEIVRQLRLRDIGGIIVIDFIDMVLESNRDLVLRRLIECLGRDRTRHQVAEVTSLGLVQMTRKRIGTGLLEAFSEQCEHCQGRGLIVHQEPVEQKRKQTDEEPRRNRRTRGRGKGGDDEGSETNGSSQSGKEAEVRRPTPAEFAAMARQESAAEAPTAPSDTPAAAPAEAPAPAEAETEVQPAPAPIESEREPELQPEPEPEPPAPPPPPAAPRIVTSVRRVGARRPAGPPTGQQPVQPAEQPAEQPTEQPNEQPAEPVAQPAGPDGIAVLDASTDGATEPSVDGLVGHDAAGQPHVPVKKKGARKR